MSLLDEIKKDMESGTPGRWEKSYGFLVVDPRDERPICKFRRYGNDAQERADVNRTVRIPDMEKALLAAEELAKLMSKPMAIVAGKYSYDDDAVDAALAAFRDATE